MEKKTKKKLTVRELDLEQLEGVTGGTDVGGTDVGSTESIPSTSDSPYRLNTGKPLPIM
jgi:hypothetical protein